MCPRCHEPLRVPRPAYASKICDEGLALDDPAAAIVATAAPIGGLDGQSRERVRRLERELRRPSIGKPFAVTHSAPLDSIARRIDGPTNQFDGFSVASSAAAPAIVTEPERMAAARRHSNGSQVFAWLVVVLGVLALGAGMGLIGWSLSARDMTYWNQALGLAFGGQGLLIFGLVLAVARLWRTSRHAANRLQEVHVRLGQLQQTADALVAKNRGGAPAFYADLVRGASPHVLLANLKGQVEQLAMRLGTGS